VSLPLVDRARIIATTLARLAGEYEAPATGECRVLPSPVEAVMLVYATRRGESPRDEAIRTLSCTLAAWGGELDPYRIPHSVLRPKPLGLLRLYKALREYAGRPSLEGLAVVLEVLGGELRSPCARDPVLEAERERLESRMKTYGALLGVSLPALFVASFYIDVLIGFLVLVAASALWYLILREGGRFRALNIEAGWRACRLSWEDLERILGGAPDAPSPFEILGIPGPRLD